MKYPCMVRAKDATAWTSGQLGRPPLFAGGKVAGLKKPARSGLYVGLGSLTSSLPCGGMLRSRAER